MSKKPTLADIEAKWEEVEKVTQRITRIDAVLDLLLYEDDEVSKDLWDRGATKKDKLKKEARAAMRAILEMEIDL